jgi:hypothetical protein
MFVIDTSLHDVEQTRLEFVNIIGTQTKRRL